MLKKIFGNIYFQKLLYYNVLVSQHLMGIGTGGKVKSSGEFILIKKIKDLESSRYIIFDVGANKGDFTSLLLSSLDNNYYFNIHCFEPSKTAFKELYKSFKEFPYIKLNNIGLGKVCGEFDLFYDSEGSGLASLTKRRLNHLGIDFSKSEKILLNTIDNYCSQENIQNIDLLKIDVEGHELDVLNGAEKMFKNNAIKIVSFEFGGCNIDTRTFFKDFYYFFKERNMRIYRITPSGYLHPIPSYREIYEQFRTTNFLAINNKQDSDCDSARPLRRLV